MTERTKPAHEHRPSLAVGATVSAVVTAGTYTLLDPEITLLIGVAAVYLAGGAVSAHRPAVWQVEGSKWAGIFAGVSTFGVVSLINGLGADARFDAVVLAFGLAAFAYVCGAVTAIEGMAAAKEGDSEPESMPAD